MKTFFCLPAEHIPSGNWVTDLISGKPLVLNVGGLGLNQNWIYQTWALLITSGIACYTLPVLPEEGIIITLGMALPSGDIPKSVFIVDVVADSMPHPQAHLHLIQNRAHAAQIPNALFIPHWPQPGLVPRNHHRGTHFENISFFGHLNNLAKELQSEEWRHRLKEELGLHLHFPDFHEWHDYSQTDAIIAIRDFSTSLHHHKPATKLYNAWHAGVPFIGGRDSAYAADGEAGLNYLVATSPEEVFQHLQRLKEDVSWRSSLIQQGFIAGQHFTRDAILKEWRKLVVSTLPALARKEQQKLHYLS